MAETKKSKEPKDFNDYRFKFRVTAGDNIIIERSFAIGAFNPMSLSSVELADTIRYCGIAIDNSLKEKTQVYLEIAAPRIFDSLEEMNTYFENPEHCAQMTLGEGIVVRGMKAQNYFWGKNGKPEKCSLIFDRGDLTRSLTDEDRVFYKLAFVDGDREVCAYGWEGVYPKFVRNSIDLRNKTGQFEGWDMSKLNFTEYILHKMVEGKRGIDWMIINEICSTCSQENKFYTTSFRFGKKKYNNIIEKLGPNKK